MNVHSSLRYSAPTNVARKSPSSVPDASGTCGIERLDGRRTRSSDRAALIDADVERPALVELPALRQADVREHARTELRRLLVHARLQLRALPRHSAHADARHVGIERHRRRRARTRAKNVVLGAPVVVEAEHRARREVDAGVLAAEREVLRSAQRDQVLEQIEAAVHERVLRLGIAVQQTRVRDVPRAGADRVVVGIAAQLRR